MGLKSFLAKQARRPSGWFGRVITSWILNKANASLEDMGLELMDIKEVDHILEIGFGNGRLISKMASRLNSGFIAGIEISDAMLTVARKKNKKHIELGVVELKEASVSNIPYSDQSFDKVFTSNTIYFWPDPEKDIQEVYRVLKPGGTFYCAMRPKKDLLSRNMIKSQRNIFENIYSPEEMEEFLRSSGFKEVRTHIEEGKAFSNMIVEGRR